MGRQAGGRAGEQAGGRAGRHRKQTASRTPMYQRRSSYLPGTSSTSRPESRSSSRQVRPKPGRSRMGRTPQDHRSGGAGWAGHHGTSRIFALCEALPPLNRPFSYPPDRLTAALAQTPAASTASGPTAAGCTTTRSLRRSAPPPLPPSPHPLVIVPPLDALYTLCRRSVDAL